MPEILQRKGFHRSNVSTRLKQANLSRHIGQDRQPLGDLRKARKPDRQSAGVRMPSRRSCISFDLQLGRVDLQIPMLSKEGTVYSNWQSSRRRDHTVRGDRRAS